MRTPRCQLDKNDIYEKIRNLLAIDENTTQEVDLRKMYSLVQDKESIAKLEQKKEITG